MDYSYSWSSLVKSKKGSSFLSGIIRQHTYLPSATADEDGKCAFLTGDFKVALELAYCLESIPGNLSRFFTKDVSNLLSSGIQTIKPTSRAVDMLEWKSSFTCVESAVNGPFEEDGVTAPTAMNVDSIDPKIDPNDIQIREVWGCNLEFEFRLIRSIVDEFPFVAMDTEYPGIVIKHTEKTDKSSEARYQVMRANVNMLHLIQLGLTFSDENGNLPKCGTSKFCVWQFNFKEFDPRKDAYAEDSYTLLLQSGINFDNHYNHGVEAQAFSELLTSSGAVLNADATWITFHSGYDFAYLLKMLTGKMLPMMEYDYFELMNVFFPTYYDIKYALRFANNLHGGLSRIAAKLDVFRVGQQHQAGSDSLLTCSTFHKLKRVFTDEGKYLGNYAGVLYGFGLDFVERPISPLPR
ncbi:hypothetical protein R1sor_017149 [Riccia sorocarpa]|uniref:poly(A)-specific ribonuclease n=1 Tax=Riccia sorocarpa TaxID=122646 RepID=A0ABD3I8R7_9MARC